jgi:hypothetical protein
MFMSKINPVQAAALSAPVEKIAPATKTAVTKPAAAKTPAAKTSAVKPTTKPAVAKAAPASSTAKTTVAKKAEKAKPVKEKTPKLKMERDSFTMPKTEYAQFHVLKERLNKLAQPAKKSELLRAGIMQLSAMTDAALKAALAKVPAIKTGRPKKK